VPAALLLLLLLLTGNNNRLDASSSPQAHFTDPSIHCKGLFLSGHGYK